MEIQYLCSGRIPWLLEQLLEILEQCKTPEGFDKAEKVFGDCDSPDSQNLKSYIVTSKDKKGGSGFNTLKNFFDFAIQKFKILKEKGSNKDAFHPEYIGSLKDLRDSLFKLVEEGKKIGIS